MPSREWCSIPHRCWPDIAEVLARSRLEWPLGAVDADLCWMDEQGIHLKPSLPAAVTSAPAVPAAAVAAPAAALAVPSGRRRSK